MPMATMEQRKRITDVQLVGTDQLMSFLSLPYRCENKCPYGTYGFYCSRTCQCQNSAICSHIDGSCACAAGWQGRQCELPCSSGFYGNCRQQCVCLNGASCNRMNGVCTCTDGWLGENCSQPCSV